MFSIFEFWLAIFGGITLGSMLGKIARQRWNRRPDVHPHSIGSYVEKHSHRWLCCGELIEHSEPTPCVEFQSLLSGYCVIGEHVSAMHPHSLNVIDDKRFNSTYQAEEENCERAFSRLDPENVAKPVTEYLETEDGVDAFILDEGSRIGNLHWRDDEPSNPEIVPPDPEPETVGVDFPSVETGFVEIAGVRVKAGTNDSGMPDPFDKNGNCENAETRLFDCFQMFYDRGIISERDRRILDRLVTAALMAARKRAALCGKLEAVEEHEKQLDAIARKMGL